MTTFYNFTPKKEPMVYLWFMLIYGLISHSVHLGINPSQKHHPLFFGQASS